MKCAVSYSALYVDGHTAVSSVEPTSLEGNRRWQDQLHSTKDPILSITPAVVSLRAQAIETSTRNCRVASIVCPCIGNNLSHTRPLNPSSVEFRYSSTCVLVEWEGFACLFLANYGRCHFLLFFASFVFGELSFTPLIYSLLVVCVRLNRPPKLSPPRSRLRQRKVAR